MQQATCDFICFCYFDATNLQFLNMQLCPYSNMGQLFVKEQIPLGCISETLSRKPCLVNRLFFLILQVTEKMELSGIQQLGKCYYSDILMVYEKSFQLLLLLYSKIIERKFVRKGVRKGCSISCYRISQPLPDIRLQDFFCA